LFVAVEHDVVDHLDHIAGEKDETTILRAAFTWDL
jgi:hypothetical protein